MDTEKALDLVEAFRDLCVEFEMKVPAHAVSHDATGIAIVSEKPPQVVLEALWLPMVDKYVQRGLPVEYHEVEERDVLFAVLFVSLPGPVCDGITIYGDRLDFYHKCCENMLWTHNPTFGGATGVTALIDVAINTRKS